MKSLHELKTIETRGHAGEFFQLARALLRAKHGGIEFLATDEGRRTSERVQRILKAPVSGATTGEHGALVDETIVSNGFISSLVGISAFDTLMPAMRRMPYETPNVRVLSSIQGHDVAEGAPKPVSAFSVDPRTLPPFKAVAIVVVSNELADAMDSAASGLINGALRDGVTAATDERFLSILASGITPASLSGSPPDVLGDLEVLLGGVETDARSRLFMIVPPAVMRRLVVAQTTTGSPMFPNITISGGTIQGVNVMPSDHLPTTGSPPAPLSMMVDARQIAVADRGVRLDVAHHASLEMDSSPSGAGQLTNLWQSNSRAVRATRQWRVARIRESAVAVATVNW